MNVLQQKTDVGVVVMFSCTCYLLPLLTLVVLLVLLMLLLL